MHKEAREHAETLADAVVAGWPPGAANAVLRAMLRKLLALREERYSNGEAGFQEDVSDMVYVMY